MKTDDVEKAEKFREAAIRRVRNVETTLRRVRNLSNQTSYSYTDDEVEKIFSHLQTILDRTRDSFAHTRERQHFSL